MVHSMEEVKGRTKLVRIPTELTDRAAAVAALSEEVTGVPAMPGTVIRTALKVGLDSMQRAMEPARKLVSFPFKAAAEEEEAQ